MQYILESPEKFIKNGEYQASLLVINSKAESDHLHLNEYPRQSQKHCPQKHPLSWEPPALAAHPAAVLLKGSRRGLESGSKQNLYFYLFF